LTNDQRLDFVETIRCCPFRQTGAMAAASKKDMLKELKGIAE
jgi:hypothetical protein